MYSHQVLRINYTTYDVRRGQDSINPFNSRRYIMLKAYDDQTTPTCHPFWYAEVLRIFHINVVHIGPRSKTQAPKRFYFLWIRWLGTEPGYRAGWKAFRLDRVGFVAPEHDSPRFGFLDPDSVIRGAHLMPAFMYGLTSRFLAPSLIIRDVNEQDWESFYVNRYSVSYLFSFAILTIQ